VSVVVVLFGLCEMLPVLVVLLDRCLMFFVRPSAVGRRKPLPFGAGETLSVFLRRHAERRQEPFEILPLAGRTRRDLPTPDQGLVLMSAPAAFVFVERHRYQFTR
jgi:hypothetical protein